MPHARVCSPSPRLHLTLMLAIAQKQMARCLILPYPSLALTKRLVLPSTRRRALSSIPRLRSKLQRKRKKPRLPPRPPRPPNRPPPRHTLSNPASSTSTTTLGAQSLATAKHSPKTLAPLPMKLSTLRPKRAPVPLRSLPSALSPQLLLSPSECLIQLSSCSVI